MSGTSDASNTRLTTQLSREGFACKLKWTIQQPKQPKSTSKWSVCVCVCVSVSVSVSVCSNFRANAVLFSGIGHKRGLWCNIGPYYMDNASTWQHGSNEIRKPDETYYVTQIRSVNWMIRPLSRYGQVSNDCNKVGLHDLTWPYKAWRYPLPSRAIVKLGSD